MATVQGRTAAILALLAFFIYRERLWDWKDPEFVRCLCAGPVYPEGLGFLRELFHNRRAEIGPRDRPEVFTEQPRSVANRGSALELFGSSAGDRAANLFRIACERDLLRFAVSEGNLMCAQVNKTLEESLAFRPAPIVDVVAGQLFPVKTVVITSPHITEIAATGPVPVPRAFWSSA